MDQDDPEHAESNPSIPSSEPKTPESQVESKTPEVASSDLTGLWILLTSKEQVEDYMARVIKVIHEQGFFVSGQITIDDKRTCPNCGYQMTWVSHLRRHECSKCMAKVIEAFSAQSKTSDLNLKTDLNLETAYSGADTKICDHCGNIAIRMGTCYTCQTCGTNSGCG